MQKTLARVEDQKRVKKDVMKRWKMRYSSSIIANYLVSQKKEIKYQKLSRLKRKGNPSNDNEIEREKKAAISK